MLKSKIIAGIDIGTSKISIIVCHLKSIDNIEVLGIGTSVLKGVQRGVIKDKALFSNAFQNCLKRAEATSDQVVEDIFLNVPNGNGRFAIETGIINEGSPRNFSSSEVESAMRKSIHCIEKKNQSILHLIPVSQRVDGQQLRGEKQKQFNNLEVDTGVVLCDTLNLKLITSTAKRFNLKIKGIISDYLSIGALIVPKLKSEACLIIDLGSQLTSISIFINHQLKYAHTIHIGSEQISQDLSICLKCSFSEAERIKILYGQLKNFSNDFSKHLNVHCYNGQKQISFSVITSIIESRMNQLFQIIQKYLINAPNFDEIVLTGSGANLKGLSEWVVAKFTKPINMDIDRIYKEANINSNYSVAMGQIVYGHQIGLLNTRNLSMISKISEKIFKK